MTNYSRGEIVLAEVPYIDSNQSKRRPVLIISTDTYNQSRSDVIVLPITSQYSSFESFYIKDWKEIGLARPSEIRYTILTIPQRFIVKKYGRLPRGSLLGVTKRIAEKIGITT